jgi:hypothetical protein
MYLFDKEQLILNVWDKKYFFNKNIIKKVLDDNENSWSSISIYSPCIEKIRLESTSHKMTFIILQDQIVIYYAVDNWSIGDSVVLSPIPNILDSIIKIYYQHIFLEPCNNSYILENRHQKIIKFQDLYRFRFPYPPKVATISETKK